MVRTKSFTALVPFLPVTERAPILAQADFRQIEELSGRLRYTVVHGSARRTHCPLNPVPAHATRTDSGRPNSSIRFRTWTPTATSVARPGSVRERRASPTTRL